MRVNVYSQELTDEVELVEKSEGDQTFRAVRLYLHSSGMLHHTPDDDDRSAVTIWLPKSRARRDQLAQTLQEMARLVRNSK